MSRTMIAWLLLTPAPLLAQQPFVDATADLGVVLESNSMWGAGIAFFDYDGDSDLDIYVVDGMGDPNVLFRHDALYSFTNVAGDVGVDTNMWGKATVPADIDNDGDLDLLLTTYAPTEFNMLWRNDGGTFVDITSGSGVDFMDKCTGAAWADYDGDALLDAYITVYDGSHRNRLMRNLGNGVFEDVAQALGVEDDTGWGYQPTWFDYDSDGDQDLYVGNDDFFGGTGNVLFRNNGDGTFTDVSVESGAGVSMSTMGFAVGDYDNDMDLDVYITNITSGNALLRNNGDGTFTDIADDLGIAVENVCWGADFFDYDNDGLLDLYVDVMLESGGMGVSGSRAAGDLSERLAMILEGTGFPNRLFHSLGELGFEDISATSGVDNEGKTFCSAIADCDADGDLDFYITNFWMMAGDETSAFYENQLNLRGEASEDWLRVALMGTTSNRDGVGAKVWIRTSDGWQLREYRCGTGYLSASEPYLHFGLGDATNVSHLFVRWPSGLIEGYTDIASGQVVTLVEGEGSTSSVDRLPGLGRGQFLSAFPNPTSGRSEIRLRLPAATGAVEIYDIRGRTVQTLQVSGKAGQEVVLRWNGLDGGGRRVGAGSYFLRLISGGLSVRGARIVLLD